MNTSENQANTICWLSELQKYRDTPNVSQTENFLTTTLAWTLNSHPELKTRFLEKLFPDHPEKASFADARVEIQRHLNDSMIPDFTVLDSNAEPIACIEFKVDSEAREDQVCDYLNSIPAKYRDSSAVAFVGRYDPDFTQLHDRCFTWYQINKTIRDAIAEKSSTGERLASCPLVQGLLYYMRRNDMQTSAIREGKTETLRAVFDVVDLAVDIVARRLRKDGSDYKKHNRSCLYRRSYSHEFFRGNRVDGEDGDWICLGLCWQTDTLTWAVQIGSRFPQYERATGPDWKLHWSDEWPIGKTLPTSLSAIEGFLNLPGDKQAEVLAKFTIEELNKLAVTPNS